MPEQQVSKDTKQDPKRAPDAAPEAAGKEPVKTVSGEVVVIDHNTRIISPPHEEIEAAAHYLRKRFPDIPEEQMTETLCDRINVDGLSKGVVIYVAARKSYGRRRLTDFQTYRDDAATGSRLTVHTSFDVLAEEVKLYGPLRVKDHWSETPNGWSSEVNRSSLINELGRLAAPWAILQPDAPSKKSGETPRFVCLSTC